MSIEEEIPKAFVLGTTRRDLHSVIDDKYAIYKVDIRPDQFELMIVRRRKTDNQLTGAKAGSAFLPATSDWGYYGWTCCSLAVAHKKIIQLKDEEQRKKNKKKAKEK